MYEIQASAITPPPHVIPSGPEPLSEEEKALVRRSLPTGAFMPLEVETFDSRRELDWQTWASL